MSLGAKAIEDVVAAAESLKNAISNAQAAGVDAEIKNAVVWNRSENEPELYGDSGQLMSGEDGLIIFLPGWYVDENQKIVFKKPEGEEEL